MAFTPPRASYSQLSHEAANCEQSLGNFANHSQPNTHTTARHTTPHYTTHSTVAVRTTTTRADPIGWRIRSKSNIPYNVCAHTLRCPAGRPIMSGPAARHPSDPSHPWHMQRGTLPCHLSALNPAHPSTSEARSTSQTCPYWCFHAWPQTGVEQGTFDEACALLAQVVVALLDFTSFDLTIRLDLT